MTTQFVSDEHKETLELIHACHMVRAHMINAMPQDGVPIPATEVTASVREMVGPIYDLCAKPEEDGLKGAITNARATLCANKRFIERGGSEKYPNELPRGHWRFAADGRKAAIDWINKLGGYNGYFEHLIELAADIARS